MALGSKPSSSGKFVSSVWSFPKQDLDRTSPYRWYGTLPTGLLDQLLDLYATPESSVFDPFSGSGSTLVAAAHRGVSYKGLDVNPLAVLVSRVRLAPLEASELTASWEKVKTLAGDRNFSEESRALLAKHLQAGKLEYTSRWMSEKTLFDLWTVMRATAQLTSAPTQAALFVAIANIVREVANVDPRCTHHLVTKIKPQRDCIDLLDSRMITPWAGFLGNREQISVSGTVEQGDITSMSTPGEHDLVIVHPPYLGVIHYNQIHRLSTDLLDLVSETDMPSTLSGLDWAHSGIKSGDMSTDNSARYEGFVKSLADVLVKSTVVDGRVVVIIGDQRHKGMLRHPFTSYIQELEERGFALEENFIWVLQNNGGMHVLRRGNFIDHNYVLVFKRLP